MRSPANQLSLRDLSNSQLFDVAEIMVKAGEDISIGETFALAAECRRRGWPDWEERILIAGAANDGERVGNGGS